MQSRKKAYETDYQFGKRREKECFKQIRKFFNPKLQMTQYEYAPYDYWSTTHIVELKSRTTDRNRYNTTIISLTKVNYAKENPQYITHFVFDFNDGMYYIKYDPELFEKFDITQKIRRDRKLEINDYVNIPISKLKPM